MTSDNTDLFAAFDESLREDVKKEPSLSDEFAPLAARLRPTCTLHYMLV